MADTTGRHVPADAESEGIAGVLTVGLVSTFGVGGGLVFVAVAASLAMMLRKSSGALRD